MTVSDAPRLYTDLAPWWPLMSPRDDYAEEAAVYEQLLFEATGGTAKAVLELGSGGGNNASFLKARFDLVLVDQSPGMLEASRALNPECEHIVGDMRSVRLGREFDAVFIHDAIMYMTSREDLRRALETAALHCRPGGIVLVCPDATRELFVPSTEHGGIDGEDGRALRYLEWSYDPDPSDDTCLTEYIYALREGQDVRVVHDRHVEGLFPRDVWLRCFSDVGLQATTRILTHSTDPPVQTEVFLGTRAAPADPRAGERDSPR